MSIKTLPIFLIFAFGLSACDFFKKKTAYSNENFKWLADSVFVTKKLDSSDIADKIVIINFWASWCAPCQEETPALLKLAHQYPAQVVLISINAEADIKESKKFMKLFPNFKGTNIFVLHDANRNWSNQYSVTGLPETFLFDSKSVLVYKVTGLIDFQAFNKKLQEVLLTKKID